MRKTGRALLVAAALLGAVAGPDRGRAAEPVAAVHFAAVPEARGDTLDSATTAPAVWIFL